MHVNSSSNDSLPSHLLCYSNSVYPQSLTCFESSIIATIFTAFTITNVVFLLPLYILILAMGFQRWRHRGSGTTGTTSHSDVITYYMVSLEILNVLVLVFYCSAIYTCSLGILMVGYYGLSMTFPGQTFFHCLTCMEHHMAVVHPITYLNLRKAGGVKLRNISIGCVWLLCFGMTGLTALNFPAIPGTLYFAVLGISLIVISFCSLSALCVLIRLGLGKVGGDRQRIDRSKLRAFHTIMAIMGTLVLRMGGLLVINSMSNGTGKQQCMLLLSGFWMSLPSSLVLPLLFLHRAGALTCSLRQSEN